MTLSALKCCKAVVGSARRLPKKDLLTTSSSGGALPLQFANCSPVLNALWKEQPHGLPEILLFADFTCRRKKRALPNILRFYSVVYISIKSGNTHIYFSFSASYISHYISVLFVSVYRTWWFRKTAKKAVSDRWLKFCKVPAFSVQSDWKLQVP